MVPNIVNQFWKPKNRNPKPNQFGTFPIKTLENYEPISNTSHVKLKKNTLHS